MKIFTFFIAFVLGGDLGNYTKNGLIWTEDQQNLNLEKHSTRLEPEHRHVSKKKLNIPNEMVLGYLSDNNIDQDNLDKIVYSPGTPLDYSGEQRKGKKPIFAQTMSYPPWNETDTEELLFKANKGMGQAYQRLIRVDFETTELSSN